MTSGSGIISLSGSDLGPYFYRASKVALNMVLRVLADELRSDGIDGLTLDQSGLPFDSRGRQMPW